jgi:rhamnose utilization protein RhaD (predicted bifunctional aldolase and dehydrogenase)
MQVKKWLRYLEDGWDEQIVRGLDQPELLRYRSNLLGSGLRITILAGPTSPCTTGHIVLVDGGLAEAFLR